jgi:hypothetical protein
MKKQTLTGNSAEEICSFKPMTPPKVVGGYKLGKQTSNNLQFTMTHKPIWFHRQMMRICFGWCWFDVK